MKDVTLSELFKNAVHFGHKKSHWNPKMKKFIFAEKDGVHILDLDKTKEHLEEAVKMLKVALSEGKKILFVGTKPQARALTEQLATKVGAPHITNKWPAGLLTNWDMFKERIAYMKSLREEKESGELDQKYTKKEVAKFHKELDKLEGFLSGVEDMTRVPDVVFVVDPLKEKLAVKEAQTKHIPVVGIVDTNANPDGIAHIIPANDDANKSLSYIFEVIASALEGAAKPKKQENVKKMD